MTTTLPATLGQVERSILVSHSGITLLTIQFAVLAGYAIVLVAGMLLERRRSDLALMRSRGASTVHLAAMALTEAAILAALAALAADPAGHARRLPPRHGRSAGRERHRRRRDGHLDRAHRDGDRGDS